MKRVREFWEINVPKREEWKPVSNGHDLWFLSIKNRYSSVVNITAWVQEHKHWQWAQFINASTNVCWSSTMEKNNFIYTRTRNTVAFSGLKFIWTGAKKKTALWLTFSIRLVIWQIVLSKLTYKLHLHT